MSSGGKGVAVVLVIVVAIALYFYWQSLQTNAINAAPVEKPQARPPGNAPKDGPVIDVTPEKAQGEPIVASSKPTETGSALAIQPPKDVSVKGFKHSEDYRMVVKDGEEFHLTLYQSRAIEKLHKAQKDGLPMMHQARILEGIETCSKRLRDVFRSNMRAFRVLIARGVRRGTFGLVSV